MFYSMSFYYDELNDEAIFAQRSNVEEIKTKSIKKGFFDNIYLSEAVEIPFPKVKFYIDDYDGSALNDFLRNINNWPLISNRVREKLEGTKGFLFFPVSILDSTGVMISEYYLLYTDNFIDAYDLDKCRYRYNEQYDFYFFLPADIHLDANACKGFDVFRCNQNKTILYVSDSVKDVIDKNGFTGFDFRRCKE